MKLRFWVKMEVNYIHLLTLCWALIAIGSAGADSEVKVTSSTGLDPETTSVLNNTSNSNGKTSGSNPVVDSDKVNEVKKDKDQVSGSKEDVQNNNLKEKDSSEQKQEGSKGDRIQKRTENGSEGQGLKKEKSSEGSESKEAAKEVPITLPPVRKEGSGGEECDASNSCKVDENALVACLRVPGNESPDVSLLIQNKGKGPLSVTISAPAFVQLEKTKIDLQAKQNGKVKVSIGDGGTDSLIVLNAGNGNCSLDFRDLISLHSGQTDFSSKSTYINLVRRTPFVLLFVFAIILVTASAWMCVSFQKRHFSSSGSKYQRLDMELPVSAGAKAEPDSNDGWDNSWGDNWDDEEAPMTPSMPVTPSLSAKGLASRRFNKEGWKD